MADEYIVDHRSTYEHFLHVLSLGRWLDLSEFDRVSRKPLSKLYKEVQRGAATLRFDPETGWIDRFASNTKIRFVLDIMKQTYLCEAARGYPDGHVDWHPRPLDWAVRETLEPADASERECAMRGLLQEGKRLWQRIGTVPVPADLHLWRERRRPEVYVSSAYMGVRSRVFSTGFDLYLGALIGDERSAREAPIILRDTDGEEETADNWVDIYLVQKEIASEEWREIYSRWLLTKAA